MSAMFFVKFISAFVLVIALMLLLAWFLKRIGLANNAIGSGERRLKLVEFLPLDNRRKLVLIRRDDKEHLLLLSSTGEIVVEQNIPTDNSKDITDVKN